MARRHTRELRVAFDTSVLHTQVPGDIVNASTRDLILANAAHPDLQITWYVPDIVILERQYQMHAKALDLLTAFNKADKLLGIGVTLQQEQLPARIESVIESQLSSLTLNRAILDSACVDWNEMVRNSALRSPPFQAGSTEKGFRDAIVLETFVQIAQASPRTHRLALVAADKLLAAAAKLRIKDFGNAEVLTGLEDLRNLINTLSSTVDEEFVRELRDRADRIFFVPGDKDSFWVRGAVQKRITEAFPEHISALPQGATMREWDATRINQPRFIKKEGQRVHWISVIDYEFSAYQYIMKEPSPVIAPPIALGEFLKAPTEPQMAPALAAYNSPILSTLFNMGSTERVLVKKGSFTVNVSWSATLDKHHRLKGPRIDDLVANEIIWT